MVAGDTEEKIEISARIAWCGVGVNLKTEKPSVEALSGVVEEVLNARKYRLRAKELMGEMGGFDPSKVLVESIEEVLKEKSFKT